MGRRQAHPGESTEGDPNPNPNPNPDIVAGERASERAWDDNARQNQTVCSELGHAPFKHPHARSLRPLCHHGCLVASHLTTRWVCVWQLPNPNSKVDMINLDSGELALGFNDYALQPASASPRQLINKVTSASLQGFV
jgi:hypothetical protein